MNKSVQKWQEQPHKGISNLDEVNNKKSISLVFINTSNPNPYA